MFDHGVFNKTFPLDVFGPWIIDQAGSSTSGGGPSEYEAPSVRGKILDATSGAPVKSASVEIARERRHALARRAPPPTARTCSRASRPARTR